MRCPRINQDAVVTEVLIGGQPRVLYLAVDLSEERARDIGFEQPVAVFRKREAIPHRLVARQAHRPAKQQIVIELLTQQPLAGYRVEHLPQRPKQPLRGYQRAALRRVNGLELPDISGSARSTISRTGRSGCVLGIRASSDTSLNNSSWRSSIPRIRILPTDPF